MSRSTITGKPQMSKLRPTSVLVKRVIFLGYPWKTSAPSEVGGTWYNRTPTAIRATADDQAGLLAARKHLAGLRR